MRCEICGADNVNCEIIETWVPMLLGKIRYLVPVDLPSETCLSCDMSYYGEDGEIIIERAVAEYIKKLEN